ncbi:MAG: chemotaxis protein CheW [Gammaproteobacteria bacterium]|nr:chemotaxis protein CheW [Gammaproteobacteria bacterium]HXK55180.1 chemotaxis protein CheW [Gammaproteobacteria bacterium]
MSGKKKKAEVRGVLLPLHSGHLLIPNMLMPEVIGYREPDEIPRGSPDWLLGVVLWRHFPVPVVSFDALLGAPEQEVGHRARIALCKTISEASTRPYTAFLLQSIPRLVSVTEKSIAAIQDDNEKIPMIAHHVKINDQEAWIPDLDTLEQSLEKILG